MDTNMAKNVGEDVGKSGSPPPPGVPFDLPLRPKEKLSPLPKGTKTQKRALNRPMLSNTTGSGNQHEIYVSTTAGFIGIVHRVRKALGHGPRAPRGRRSHPKSLPVDARISSEDKVLVIGTGRAIEKTVHVGAWFQRDPLYRVSLRTRSIPAVDDVVPDLDHPAQEPVIDDMDPRVRMLSVLEVSISMR